ncbi:MAG: HlyD family efflux transporter periplasmic adaptor subunit [Chloroflexota bacterium]
MSLSSRPPFDGVIASINVKEKDFVAPPVAAARPIIHLIDPMSMELQVKVNEIDIPGVSLGQTAIIEVDALPNEQFEGTVSFIDVLPTIEGGVTSYVVKLQLDVPEGAGLKDGMSATADIITAERQNVLLIPSRLIKQDNEGNLYVEVMVNNKIEQRDIVTGVSDDIETEIVSGLQEGDIVVDK